MIPHPPLLSPDYDGNYTPSNRRDWWVTPVAVVYKCRVHTFEPFCLHNEGVRYQLIILIPHPPLLSPDYDGNYTPSNRRDWWVTLLIPVVAIVYSRVHTFVPFCFHNEGVRYQFDTSPPSA